MSATSTVAPRSTSVGAIRGTIALLTIAGFGTTASLVTCSDRDEPMMALAAESIDLELDGAINDRPDGLASLGMRAARVGDRTVREIAVGNVGTLPLVYDLAVTSTTDGARDLATALRLTVIADAATCAVGAVTEGTTGGTRLVVDAPLSPSPAFSAPQALQPGGIAQRLCISVALPVDAPAWTMGTSSRVTLRFEASQGGGGSPTTSVSSPTTAPGATDPKRIICSR